MFIHSSEGAVTHGPCRYTIGPSAGVSDMIGSSGHVRYMISQSEHVRDMFGLSEQMRDMIGYKPQVRAGSGGTTSMGIILPETIPLSLRHPTPLSVCVCVCVFQSV